MRKRKDSPADLQPLAELLEVDVQELAALAGVTAADRAFLAQQIEAAIAERRHLIRRALDDAQRFLPRPLRGRIAGLLRDD